jgi:Ser/Thr protein kinase RdoA (MazF antagonist)
VFPRAMCRRWCGTDVAATPLVGGLSGARAWAVDHDGHRFVLKSFATSAGREHAAWVHAFMRLVRAAGVLQVPMIVAAPDGETLQADEGGSLWELLQWMPGNATTKPSGRQAAAAADVLARAHRAAGAWPACPRRVGHSPGVLHRVARARALLARPWATRLDATYRGPLREQFERAIAIFAAVGGGQAVARVAEWESRAVVMQPVLRDIWSDHVLFVGEQVAGVIDWHAAGIDTPATDVARLVAGWAVDQETMRAFLDSYSAIRPLSGDEVSLVPFLRDTGILFGLDNWFRWIVEESRLFADIKKAEARVDFLLSALPGAVRNLVRSVSQGFCDSGLNLD